LAVGTAYLMRSTNVSADALVALIVGLLLLAWVRVAGLNGATERRSRKVGRILAKPEALRMTYDPKANTLHLQQVGRVAMGNGEMADTVLECAVITLDEAERLGAALDSGRPIRLLAAPLGPARGTGIAEPAQ
jgi:hypothetical protein